MLYDLLNEFKNHYIDGKLVDTDEMVLQSYIPKAGLYIKINKDDSLEELYISKKTSIPPEKNKLFDWFKFADFYSSLIEMNKPVDSKKQIHSNNIYTVFAKYSVFMNTDKSKPNIQEHIKRYFDILSTPPEKQTAEILKAAGYSDIDKNLLQSCRQKIRNSVKAVQDKALDLKIDDKCYIKLFIEADEDDYINESNRYILPKIFNNNDYNINLDNKVVGLSNNNMGLNSKKPYLAHKTTGYKVPFRISASDAVLLRKLFLWLDSQQRDGKSITEGYIPVWKHNPELFVYKSDDVNNKPANYLHYEKGIEVAIDDYDFIPRFVEKLDKPVEFENYLQAPNYEVPEDAGEYLSKVENHIDEYLYGKQLKRNYFVEKIRVEGNMSKALADQIMQARDAFKAWFRKSDSQPLAGAVDKITMEAVIARLENLSYIPVVAHGLNVRFSLLKYFEKDGQDMGYIIQQEYEKLREKILGKEIADNSKNLFCENNIQFYLAAGQLLYYYLSQSQAQSVRYDEFLREVVAAKNSNDIKNFINTKILPKYGYAIDIKDLRHKKMQSIFNSYMPEKADDKVMVDVLLSGFSADNIIYYKTK